jgi:hypothetical protein
MADNEELNEVRASKHQNRVLPDFNCATANNVGRTVATSGSMKGM